LQEVKVGKSGVQFPELRQLLTFFSGCPTDG